MNLLKKFVRNDNADLEEDYDDIYVMPDDIKYLAPFVLGHRIDLTHEAKVNGRTNEAVIQTILDSVAVPSLSDEDIVRGAVS